MNILFSRFQSLHENRSIRVFCMLFLPTFQAHRCLGLAFHFLLLVFCLVSFDNDGSKYILDLFCFAKHFHLSFVMLLLDSGVFVKEMFVLFFQFFIVIVSNQNQIFEITVFEPESLYFRLYHLTSISLDL
jgi:hypothetical protein